MIEHAPWCGKLYESGIAGQRIAIVGYSHHRSPEHADHNQFTKTVVTKVLSGEQRGDALFTTVPRYFGFQERSEFWKRVLFFNFIPDCIGTSDEKYGAGTPLQIQRARERFERILRKERPNKVFVFTTKGWSKCPSTVEEDASADCKPLGKSSET